MKESRSGQYTERETCEVLLAPAPVDSVDSPPFDTIRHCSRIARRRVRAFAVLFFFTLSSKEAGPQWMRTRSHASAPERAGEASRVPIQHPSLLTDKQYIISEILERQLTHDSQIPKPHTHAIPARTVHLAPIFPPTARILVARNLRPAAPTDRPIAGVRSGGTEITYLPPHPTSLREIGEHTQSLSTSRGHVSPHPFTPRHSFRAMKCAVVSSSHSATDRGLTIAG